MLIRLVFAVAQKTLQDYLEKRFSAANVRIESYGQAGSAWQKVMRSCGDIIVISKSLIPPPTETSIPVLNELPETPTTVVLHDTDSSEEHAYLVAAGADVVLYSGIARGSLAEAIEAVLDSRRQLVEVSSLRRHVQQSPKTSDFVLESDAMQMFMDEVRQVIPSSSPLLIQGETGVGKEHLARAIHSESPRASGPFVAVNAAALPEQLLESELFGHAQGAFTGAMRARRGAFELAHGGTIFLDEIGEMPLHLQAKLLRVLQDYEIKPIGSERSVFIDVRVIAATNSDLDDEVKQGRFRKDLYYRLSVITLTIPPLRHRREDIPAMADGFLQLLRYRVGREITGISEPAMEALCRYHWPGNVRELMNVIERAMLLSNGDEIELGDFPHVFREQNMVDADGPLGDFASPEAWKRKTLAEVQRLVLERVERRYLEMVLKQTRGRVGEAARTAGIHPRGLYNKMKRLGLRKEDFRP